MNKSNKNSCGRTEDIVAYMYDELGSDERSRFESHLADCMSCIDEFAAVSDSRFSVYEWHKEEFAPLPTPEFSIPYTARPEPSTGFLAAIGEMIRNAGWPATAAASLVVMVGIIFAGLMFTGTGDDQIARVEVENESQPANPRVAEIPKIVEPVIDNTDATENPSGPAVTEARSVRPRGARSTKRASQKSAGPTTRTPTPVMSKAPVLSSYEDIEDRSLRLSDLLDEVGG